MWHRIELNRNLHICISIAYLPISILLIVVGCLDRLLYWEQIRTLEAANNVAICGGILLFLSVIGIVAFVKQKPKMQLAYAFLLLLTSITQFSVSCVCLSISKEKIEHITKEFWTMEDLDAPYDCVHDAEIRFNCCGYDEFDQRRNDSNDEAAWIIERKWCEWVVDECKSTDRHQVSDNATNLFSNTLYLTKSNIEGLPCPTCKDALCDQLRSIANIVGGVGLSLSFVELFTSILFYRYWKERGRYPTQDIHGVND